VLFSAFSTFGYILFDQRKKESAISEHFNIGCPSAPLSQEQTPLKRSKGKKKKG